MGQTWTLLEIWVITCIACFLQILVATGVEIAHPHLGVFKASSLWGAPTWDSTSVLEFFYQAGSPEAPPGRPGRVCHPGAGRLPRSVVRDGLGASPEPVPAEAAPGESRCSPAPVSLQPDPVLAPRTRNEGQCRLGHRHCGVIQNAQGTRQPADAIGQVREKTVFKYGKKWLAPIKDEIRVTHALSAQIRSSWSRLESTCADKTH